MSEITDMKYDELIDRFAMACHALTLSTGTHNEHKASKRIVELQTELTRRLTVSEAIVTAKELEKMRDHAKVLEDVAEAARGMLTGYGTVRTGKSTRIPLEIALTKLAILEAGK